METFMEWESQLHSLGNFLQIGNSEKKFTKKRIFYLINFLKN